MTDRIRVLVYMLEHGSITGIQAIHDLHTTELRKRVSELRQNGIPVKDEWLDVTRADGVKTRVKRYFLLYEVMEQYRRGEYTWQK